MAKQEDRYENESIDFDLSEIGSVLHGGSAVQQGMRGYSRRTDERGRNEFRGNGGSAELDPGRIHEGGRHYGRPAVTEPAPDGGPPGRPDLGEMGALQPAQLQVIEEEASGTVAFTPDALLQSRHSEALFTSDRAEVESKPAAVADRPRYEMPGPSQEPESPARDAAPTVERPTRKAAARATPQNARKAASRTARSEVSPSEARRPTAKASEEKKPAAKVGALKKPAAKVGAAKKASSVKKAGAKVGAAKKVSAEKAAAKKAPAKTSTVKKAPAKASAAKKATAKKATAKKSVR